MNHYSYYEKQNTESTCHTCKHRPQTADRFVCNKIHRIMFDSNRTGCVHWEVKE